MWTLIGETSVEIVNVKIKCENSEPTGWKQISFIIQLVVWDKALYYI